jgi:hypothetical protein
VSCSEQSVFSNFVNDCNYGLTKVFVIRGAMITAKSDFNINLMNEVVQFIASGGLENPSFIHEKIWNNNPDKNNVIMAKNWAFFAGIEYGYISFFYSPAVKKWMIKSFKKNTNPDPRNLAFSKLKYFQVK